MSVEKSNDTIGNRTLYLPACVRAKFISAFRLWQCRSRFNFNLKFQLYFQWRTTRYYFTLCQNQ